MRGILECDVSFGDEVDREDSICSDDCFPPGYPILPLADEE